MADARVGGNRGVVAFGSKSEGIAKGAGENDERTVENENPSPGKDSDLSLGALSKIWKNLMNTYRCALTALLLMTVACESVPETSPRPEDAGALRPAPDAESSGRGGEQPSADAGMPTASPACNDLEPRGEAVMFVAEPTSAPAPTGGAIGDGVYVLVSGKIFTGAGGEAGPSGIKENMTIEVQGWRWYMATERGTTTMQTAVDETTVELSTTCPTNKTSTARYSAASNSLTLHVNDDDGMRLYLLEKR